MNGMLLRVARVRAGLSRPQLAMACGIDCEHVAAFETGTAEPTRDARVTIARAVREHPEILFSPWEVTLAVRVRGGSVTVVRGPLAALQSSLDSEEAAR